MRWSVHDYMHGDYGLGSKQSTRPGSKSRTPVMMMASAASDSACVFFTNLQSRYRIPNMARISNIEVSLQRRTDSCLRAGAWRVR